MYDAKRAMKELDGQKHFDSTFKIQITHNSKAKKRGQFPRYHFFDLCNCQMNRTVLMIMIIVVILTVSWFFIFTLFIMSLYQRDFAAVDKLLILLQLTSC